MGENRENEAYEEELLDYDEEEEKVPDSGIKTNGEAGKKFVSFFNFCCVCLCNSVIVFDFYLMLKLSFFVWKIRICFCGWISLSIVAFLKFMKFSRFDKVLT